MTPDEQKKLLISKVQQLRDGVEKEARSWGDPNLMLAEEILGMLESIEIAEPPSTTPGYERFTDVAWNLTDGCSELSEAQYDFLDEWIKTQPDHLAYYIGNRADEDGTEWSPWLAKDSLVSLCVEKMDSFTKAKWEAIPDESEDDDEDDDE